MENSSAPRFPVAIAQASILTPLDSPGEDTWSALRAGHEVTDFGVVSDALLPANPDIDRASRLAITVAKKIGGILPDTPLFVGTSKGPILSQLAAINELRSAKLTPRSARHVALGPADIGCEIARTLGLRSPVHTSIAACSSGLHAFHRAFRSVEFGEFDRALVIAADASHHALFEASFHRLGVLSPPDPDGHRRCRPFDRYGEGFIVSEAAAAILLERAVPEDTRIRIARSTIAADGTGLIAIDPAGESLRHTLLRSSGTPTHFVHAHATGTAQDSIEVAAIRAAVPSAPILSSKRWIGHSLGAAGLVALALSHRAHREGMLWDATPLLKQSRSLTISQGFGGHIAAVVLES